MDFSIPDATAEVCENVRTFVREELFPLEQEATQKTFAELLPTLEQLRQAVKARGWWSPQVPSELGGMGLGFLDFAILSEALGQSPFGHYVFNCQAPDAGNMEILIEYGTPEQKKRWLNPLLAGEIRSCFSMTEPDRAGSNPVLMDTIARRDGDEYVIDGHKWFTTAATAQTSRS